MKYLFILLSLLCLTPLAAQEESEQKIPSEEELKMIYGMLHAINTELFKEPVLVYKEKDLDPVPTFKFDTEVIKNAMDTVQSNAIAYIEKGSFGYNLMMDATFPSTFHPEKLFDFIEVELGDYQLAHKNNQIEIRNVGSTNFGSKQFFIKTSEKDVDLYYRTISRQFQIDEKATDVPLAKGKVSYEFKFMTGYDRLRVEKKDIGKVLKIGSHEVKLIDVYDNKVVLDFLGKDLDDVKVINLNKSGTQQYTPYSMFELAELAEENPEYKDASSSIFSRTGIYEESYYLFKNNPTLTQEQLKEKLPVEKLLEMQKSNRFNIFSTPGPVEDEFIIQMPKPKIKHKIEVEVTGLQE